MDPEWLIIAPLFDEVTEYSLEEAKDMISYFQEKNVTLIQLLNADAVKREVEEYLRLFPKMNVAHYNHGNETSWIGDDQQPVIDLSNVELLKDRDCYAVNCSSAKQLGVEAWKLGATYFGYDDIFYFTTDAAEEFKEAVNSGLKFKVDGFTWKECLQKAKEKMTELADKLVATGRVLAAACMRWDRDSLVCYNAEAPEPTCAGRKLAIQLLGPLAGWRIPRIVGWGLLLALAGWAVALHDFAHSIWELKGTALSLEGGYVGFALCFIGILLLTWQFIEWLKR